MKKNLLLLVMLITVNILLSANNMENIYGKNDLQVNNNFNNMFASDFGSILIKDLTNPHFVEIEEANSEIDILNERSRSYENEINDYTNAIEELKPKTYEIYDLLDKIDELMVSINSTSADLYAIKTSITDQELRKKLLASIEENRQQKYDLVNKKAELNQNLCCFNQQIEVKKKYITVNNLFIKKNNERIAFLNKCIELSLADTNSLDSVMNKSLALQPQVDNILNVFF